MAKKVIISIKYLDFADVFSKKAVTEFAKCFDINKYAIYLEPGK